MGFDRHNSIGPSTAAKGVDHLTLQLALRLRPSRAGTTFEGRVDFAMEEWRPIVGYEGLYEVSSLGRVRSCERVIPSRLLKLQVTEEGYVRVHLSGKNRRCASVHALVLTAFKGPKPVNQVGRHMDNVRHNNTVENLQWGTQKENVADRIRHGTYYQGSRHPNSKLTESDVATIRALSESGLTNVAISKWFALTPSNIGQIVNRKAWKHV